MKSKNYPAYFLRLKAHQISFLEGRFTTCRRSWSQKFFRRKPPDPLDFWSFAPPQSQDPGYATGYLPKFQEIFQDCFPFADVTPILDFPAIKSSSRDASSSNDFLKKARSDWLVGYVSNLQRFDWLKLLFARFLQKDFEKF